jgi:GNAT superfamily N-acetyltransferase
MTEVSFRPATARDLPAVVALLADDVLGREREDPRLPLDARYLAAFDAIAADPNQRLAVAVIGEQVVGTLHLVFLPGLGRLGSWRGQIEAVRISADRRGAGLGQQMLAWAIEECRRHGCRWVQLTTDTRREDAHRFYERLGFAPTHLGYKLTL